MPFFLNVFDSDFTGVLALDDRQYSLDFKIKANVNTQTWMTAWNLEPYPLNGTDTFGNTNNTLTFNYSFDDGHHYAALAINVNPTGPVQYAADPNNVMAFEIVNALNANPTFQALYLAYVTQEKNPGKGISAGVIENIPNWGGTQGLLNWIVIKSVRRQIDTWKSYISNTGAEQVLQFNKRAGVAELPSYFARHTIANANIYPDSNATLIQLTPTGGTNYDTTIITNAGLYPPVYNLSSIATSGNTLTFTTNENVNLFVNQSIIVSGVTPTGYDVTYQVSTITSLNSFTVAVVGTGGLGTGGSGGQIQPMIYPRQDWQLMRGRSGSFQFQNNVVDGLDRIIQSVEYGAGSQPGDLALMTQYNYGGLTGGNPSQVLQIPYVLQYSDMIVPTGGYS